MKRIRIINTIYGHRPAGSKYVQPKRAGDPPFEVEDAEAERLVAMGVAAYADIEPVATPPKQEEDDETGDDTPEGDTGANVEETSDPDDAEIPDGTEDDAGEDEEKPHYDVEMKMPEIRELMEQHGLPYKVGMTKAEMVAALDDYFDGEVEDAEEPPELDAEGPVT